MTGIHGTCHPRFEAVKDAFAANFDRGLEAGASVAVTVDGELVVDCWGGTIDDAGTPWAQDTIINVWSTTKTMAALSALVLADHGELDLHAPVARYWPEFAANGKEAIEVRHVLGHTAGLSGWAEPMAPEDLWDHDRCADVLARQAPFWEPGTASGYHAITQGTLVGEIVRRVTGQSLGAFFAAELAGPLGADFHIGTGPEHDHRVALVIPPPPLPFAEMDPESVAFKTFATAPLSAEASWAIGWRRAEIPAAGGHGNARSVAQVQSILACGGTVGGRTFLSEAGCRTVFEQQSNGVDLVLGLPLRFGMGYGLMIPELPLSPNPDHTSYWGGWGGSLIIVDQQARMTVAYVMNKMGEGTVGDERGLGVLMAAYASLAA